MGKVLSSLSGVCYGIEERIAEGAQGAVFRARQRHTGEAVAIKILNTLRPEESREARRRLSAIQGKREELPKEFVLPFDIIESPRLGYVMPLIEGMQPLEKLLSRSRSMGSFSVHRRLQVSYRLASAFRALHTRGMYYADISWANILVDPGTSRIRIIDNDNLDPGGRGKATILGTPWFIAPELVAQRKESPDQYTDYHSLATLVYYLLLLDHPLIGDRVAADTQEMEQVWLGEKALFTHHPRDHSNRSTYGDGYHGLPERLRSLFQKAFVDGLHNPAQRVPDGRWRSAIMETIEEMVKCPNCGERQYPARDRRPTCPVCQKRPRNAYLFLEFQQGRSRVRKAIHHGARIPGHLWRPDTGFDHSGRHVLAEVFLHNKHGLSLRNISRRSIHAHLKGNDYELEPGKNIKLVAGLTFDWGRGTYPATVV